MTMFKKIFEPRLSESASDGCPPQILDETHHELIRGQPSEAAFGNKVKHFSTHGSFHVFSCLETCDFLVAVVHSPPNHDKNHSRWLNMWPKDMVPWSQMFFLFGLIRPLFRIFWTQIFPFFAVRSLVIPWFSLFSSS